MGEPEEAARNSGEMNSRPRGRRYFDGRQRGQAFTGGEARATAVRMLRVADWGGLQGGWRVPSRAAGAG